MAALLEEEASALTEPDSPLEVTEAPEDVPRTRGVKFSVSDDLDTPPPQQLQARLMAPVKPITLRIYTCVDDQIETIQFDTGRYTTADDIVMAMIERLHLPAETKDVFSVWLISPYLQLQLKSYHIPVKLFKKWYEFLTQYTTASYEVCKSDQPFLSFRRNAFFSLKEEKRLIAKKNSKDALSLLYHEAVHNVISGRYPLTKEELIELSSIQCAVEHKGFIEDEHTPENFKSILKQYFPPHLLTASGSSVKSKLLGKGSKTVGLEHDLVDGFRLIWDKVSKGSRKRMEADVDVEKSAVAYSLGQDEEKKLWQDIDLQLKLLYLQRCWNKPYYGCVMFRGQIERKATLKQLLSFSDRNIVVAINPECIHLFSDNTPREILLYLTYDLFSWDFQPATEQGENFYSSLWLEFDSTHSSQKVAKRLQIFSRQAPMMDAMITRCVDELNKIDEKLRQQRIEKGGPLELPMDSIKTERSLPLTKNCREDKLKCDLYTPDGDPLPSHFGKLWTKRSSQDNATPPPMVVNPENMLDESTTLTN